MVAPFVRRATISSSWTPRSSVCSVFVAPVVFVAILVTRPRADGLSDLGAGGGVRSDEGPYQIDPAEALRWSREQEPVFYSPKLRLLGGQPLPGRQSDLPRQRDLFSPSIALEKITPASPEAQEILKRYDYAMNRTLVNEDEPAHMERRRALMEAFTLEALAHREPMVRRLTRAYRPLRRPRRG